MGKVLGFGGVFLRARSPKELQKWYHDHLGVPLDDYGQAIFEGPETFGQTVFKFFPQETEYFGSKEQPALLNFRVDKIDEVVEQLTAAGAWIDPKRDDSPYGRFAWFRDPEGNRVELWEPAPETA